MLSVFFLFFIHFPAWKTWAAAEGSFSPFWKDLGRLALIACLTFPSCSYLSSCGCEECVTSRQEDSLRHSRSRINSYRALASPSLIALSSKDPILTAFELSWELRRLFFAEHEFKAEYMVSPPPFLENLKPGQARQELCGFPGVRVLVLESSGLNAHGPTPSPPLSIAPPKKKSLPNLCLLFNLRGFT